MSEDVIEYADRYGFSALGYALYKMVEQNEFTPDSEFVNNLWEYGGISF